MSIPSQHLTFDQMILEKHQELMDANAQLHLACQFLAMVGKNLVKQEPDDSNANLGLIAGGLISRAVSGAKPFHAFIDIPGFSLNLVDPSMHILWSTEIDGKKRDHILDELKIAVTEAGQNGDILKHIDHYKLEKDHPILTGASFKKPDKALLTTWHTLFRRAETALRQAVNPFANADEVRIWPHHFDIGSYIPLNDEGTRSIGMGLAIPDGMINDFYFYIYGWQKDQTIDMSEFPELLLGEWKDGEWKGAVLPVREWIRTGEGNMDGLSEFFRKTTQAYLTALG